MCCSVVQWFEQPLMCDQSDQSSWPSEQQPMCDQWSMLMTQWATTDVWPVWSILMTQWATTDVWPVWSILMTQWATTDVCLVWSMLMTHDPVSNHWCVTSLINAYQLPTGHCLVITIKQLIHKQLWAKPPKNTPALMSLVNRQVVQSSLLGTLPPSAGFQDPVGTCKATSHSSPFLTTKNTQCPRQTAHIAKVCPGHNAWTLSRHKHEYKYKQQWAVNYYWYLQNWKLLIYMYSLTDRTRHTMVFVTPSVEHWLE